MKIEISKIKTGVRIRKDQGDLEELAESIDQIGMLYPIIVKKMGDDSFKLLAGDRRLRASKILKLEAVECMVIKE